MKLSLPTTVRARAIAFSALILVAMSALPLSASAHYLSYPWQRWSWVDQPAGSRALLRLYYEDGCISDPGNTEAAATAWTNTQTPLYFLWEPTPDCTSPRYGRIQILDGFLPGNVNAWTENYFYYCSFSSLTGGGCYWDLAAGLNPNSSPKPEPIYASRIFENHATRGIAGSLGCFMSISNCGNYDVQSASQRQDTLKHELGHAMGLAHTGYVTGVSMSASGFPYGMDSIMDFCCPSQYTGSPWFLPSTPTLSHDVKDINFLYPGW